MKVAVYAIALNEEAHAVGWAASASEADLLAVADTGSTDQTVEVLTSEGVKVEQVAISPWRFDHARNAALDLLPDDVDYCIALDLDEQLQPGWRAELEQAHVEGWTRPRYRYTWSWNPDGTPGLVYGGDKIHPRAGRWKHPVHEVFAPDEPETQGWTGLEIHHHPDPTKSRGSYLPLLALSVAEDPDDDRNAFYYARELLFAGQTVEAAREFKRHLALPRAVWEPERAASMRYLARCEPDWAERWLLRAAAEASAYREPWVALANHYYNLNDWPSCYAAALRALAIVERPLEYLNEADAWGALPHDLAAVAAHNLRLNALTHGIRAVELDPTDARLITNLRFYKEQP